MVGEAGMGNLGAGQGRVAPPRGLDSRERGGVARRGGARGVSSVDGRVERRQTGARTSRFLRVRAIDGPAAPSAVSMLTLE